jgi:D-alanyl-D-alanine carboxypeptidase
MAQRGIASRAMQNRRDDEDELPAPVVTALAQAGLPPDALGAIAIPQTFWARPWQHRADVPMQPGSAMKLVTTIVALDHLGPNHRGRTELHTRGDRLTTWPTQVRQHSSPDRCRPLAAGVQRQPSGSTHVHRCY